MQAGLAERQRHGIGVLLLPGFQRVQVPEDDLPVLAVEPHLEAREVSLGPVSLVDRGGPRQVVGPASGDVGTTRAHPDHGRGAAAELVREPRVDPGDDRVEPTRVRRSREDVDDEVRAAQAVSGEDVGVRTPREVLTLDPGTLDRVRSAEPEEGGGVPLEERSPDPGRRVAEGVIRHRTTGSREGRLGDRGHGRRWRSRRSVRESKGLAPARPRIRRRSRRPAARTRGPTTSSAHTYVGSSPPGRWF